MNDPTYALGLEGRAGGDIDDFVNLLKNPFRQQVRRRPFRCCSVYLLILTLLSSLGKICLDLGCFGRIG